MTLSPPDLQRRLHAATHALAGLRTAFALTLTLITGCTPPSVHGLLDVSRRVIAAESQHLSDDIARDRAHFEQMRGSLDAAFDADLQQADALTPQYVREATRVYVAAREALTRHELQLIDARRSRRRNLDAAMHLQQRARALLDRRDDLIAELYTFSAVQLGAAGPQSTPTE